MPRFKNGIRVGPDSKIADRHGNLKPEVKEKVFALAQRMCTPEEIAASLGLNRSTVDRWSKDPAFAALIAEGRAKGRASLRSFLFGMAEKGSAAAAIFLAKQRDILGYTDRQDLELPNGGVVVDNRTQVQVVYVNKPLQAETDEDDTITIEGDHSRASVSAPGAD